MMMDPCELSPSYVRSIAPYQPGKPISELAREMGLEEAAIIKLASNENPRGIGPRTRAAIARIVSGVPMLMKTPSEILPTSFVICGPRPAR